MARRAQPDPRLDRRSTSTRSSTCSPTSAWRRRRRPSSRDPRRDRPLPAPVRPARARRRSAIHPNRLATNRGNAYINPLGVSSAPEGARVQGPAELRLQQRGREEADDGRRRRRPAAGSRRASPSRAGPPGATRGSRPRTTPRAGRRSAPRATRRARARPRAPCPARSRRPPARGATRSGRGRCRRRRPARGSGTSRARTSPAALPPMPGSARRRGSAPRSSSAATTSSWPHQAAWCSGVPPIWPGRSIATPSSSRISTAARRPSAAAWCSAS